MTIAIKLALTVLAVAMWLGTQKLLGKRSLKFKDSIGDYIHVLTERISLYLNASPKLANSLLISSSLVVDAVGIFLILATLFGSTLRPLLGMIILFTLRQINQAITILPTPRGMIWRDPGVPSLFVTYDVSNDLFFSGHTALAVFGALEIMHLGNPWLTALAVFIMIYEIAVVILLRAHWTMDVFAGAIAALWVNEVVFRWAPTLDQWVAQISGK